MPSTKELCLLVCVVLSAQAVLSLQTSLNNTRNQSDDDSDLEISHEAAKLTLFDGVSTLEVSPQAGEATPRSPRAQVSNAASMPGSEMLVTSDQLREYFIQRPVNHTRNAIRDRRYRWPRGRVLFDISSSFSRAEQSVISRAMTYIQGQTCIRFIQRGGNNNIRDYVYITRGTGCSSFVGRVGGRQMLSLGRGCVRHAVVVHELLHAIGLWHEQSRPDRDKWVTIKWRNIPRSSYSDFSKLAVGSVDNLGEQYDYKSVMHYGGYDFALDYRYPTIVPRWQNIKPNQLGNREGMSAADVRKVNKMYAGICSKT